jgi:hypothetical protein
MTLNSINSLVSFIFSEIKPDFILTAPLFERHINVAQTKEYAELLTAYETTRILSIELSPFKRNMGEQTQPLLVNKFGYATMPDECYYPSRLRYKYIKNGELQGWYDVILLDDMNFNDRVASNLFKPVFEYPIANIQNRYIRVAPTNLKRLHFDYLKFPNYPIYNVTTTRGFQEFDESTSSVWEWNDISSVSIIQKLFAELNSNITVEQINNYQKQKQ